MPVKIFFCYAHEDEELLNKLKAHLRPLQRQGLIDIWYDRDISAGTAWEEEIDKHLNEANIILLLVSPDFMNSDYCYGIELQRAMKRHERKEAQVIPIILRPSDWYFPPLDMLQALPKNAKAITMWQNQDAAFLDIAQNIRKLVEGLQVNQADKISQSRQFHNIARELVNIYQTTHDVSSQIQRINPPNPQKIPRQGRILVVDHIEPWRETLDDLLQRNGYYSDSVASADEALKRLDETFYHLLISNIRQSEEDPKNIGGLELLRELNQRGLSEAVKVIINSALSTEEFLHEAFEVHKVVSYLKKESFDENAFMKIVRQTFAQKMNINLALKIHWQHIIGAEQAVLNLDIDETYVRQGTLLQTQIAFELEDLLCRLFYQADSILVQPLTETRDQERRGIFRVTPFYSTRSGLEVIVRIGHFRKIEEEYDNFKLYLESFMFGGRNTAALAHCRTLRLGGIIYSLLGTTLDQLTNFGNFYRSNDVSKIIVILDKLFNQTLNIWYSNRGHPQPVNLTDYYQLSFGYTTELLEQALSKNLKSVQGKQKLYFKSLKSSRRFTNPLLTLAGLPSVFITYICTTHGNFNQNNILIDNAGHAWLIDFQNTNRGHILRDLAMLDSTIRFQLLAAEEATLEERLQMEEILCSIKHFKQVEELSNKFSTANKELEKTFTTVIHIRKIARELVAYPHDNMAEYSIALFYSALNIFQRASLSTNQREHVLLCASLLVDQLG